MNESTLPFPIVVLSYAGVRPARSAFVKWALIGAILGG